MKRLLFLSLLALISCKIPTSPCNTGKIKLNIDCNGDCDEKTVKYSAELNAFDCKNDTFIYKPHYNYRIELRSIKCNVTTKEWEAMEEFHGMEARRPFLQGGDIECKELRTMSCSETRLDFSDLSFDTETGAIDPEGCDIPANKQKNDHYDYKYTCKPDLHFFYNAKFALQPHEGLYLRGSPECKDSILKAPFASREDPVEISHLGSITCKKFSCLDSNDAPYTWPNILGMDFKCPNGWSDCIPPKWYNEKYPCGTEGHELVFTRKKANNEEHENIHWLKDHFFECSETGRILNVDVNGIKREMNSKDKLVCRMPQSCFPLMNESSDKYGCHNRSNCESIDASLIPNTHLSSFDGRCSHQDRILKIVKSETSDAPGIELSSIMCKFGEWRVSLLDESIVNDEILEKEKEVIDAKTNFVCEGRDDFPSCPPPDDNCHGEIAKKGCKPAKIVDNKLVCDKGMELVLRRLFDNGDPEEIVRIDSDMICDRRTGKWSSTKLQPDRFIMAEVGVGWKSFVVCAVLSCTEPLPYNKGYCGPSVQCIKVESPKYWLYARCPLHYNLMMYSKEKAPEPLSNLHCEPDPASTGPPSTIDRWKFTNKDGRQSASAIDNFYCQEEKVERSEYWTEAKGLVQILKDTSPECRPTKLDSICFHDQHICMPVKKITESDKMVKWTCEDGRSMWYYEKDKDEKEEMEGVECNLSVDNNPFYPFWTARKKGNISMVFVPPPHSNFVCLSIEPSKEKEKVEAEVDEEEVEEPFEWPIAIAETIVLFISLLIFVLSAALLIWLHRKEDRAKGEEKSVEDATRK